MLRRHPHIFGGTNRHSLAMVLLRLRTLIPEKFLLSQRPYQSFSSKDYGSGKLFIDTLPALDI
jgi:hypothetical protein